MNVIYMNTHDTGRFIQPYGYNVPTPNLMNLADEGTLFRHAFCAGPTCSPSRAALLTGMAPHSCGMTGLAHRGFKIFDHSWHLAQYLGNNGFSTALCGIQHEAHQVENLGYHEILCEQDYNMGGFKDDSVSWDLSNAEKAAEYIKRKKDKPFFLAFGMFNTHREFPGIDEKINPNYVLPPFPMYDTRKNREDMAAYITSAMVVDKCVGIILEALEESGHDEDTLVIFTTDHGIAFPGMKCNLYDTGIGVSLIIKYPGNKMKGQTIDSIVSQIDVFPTICDMLELDKPQWLQGVSMLPLMEGESEKTRSEVFSEVTYHASYEPMRAIRTERYKLIRYYGEYPNILFANMDDSASKNFLLENGYLKQEHPTEMLFDLYLDPLERVNLVKNINYSEIYNDLILRLENWMLETKDPLGAGFVDKPKGAIINKPECLSPKEKNYL